jgi:nitronate monooxygenase
VRDYSSEISNVRRWKDTWAAGQGLANIKAIESTADIVDRLVIEYGAAWDRVARLVGPR